MQLLTPLRATALALLLWWQPTLAQEAEDLAPPRTYHFVSLDLPNTAGALGFTTLADIDNTGDIASGFTNSSGPGILLRAPLRPIPIRCPGEADGAQPQGVNGNGAVVGVCTVDGQEQSFLFERRGRRGTPVLRLLTALSPGRLEALGLNDLGNIVGVFTGTDAVAHGAILSGTRLELLDAPFDGTTSTSLSSINTLGDIVGVYSLDREIFHGFLLTAGTFASIDVPDARSTAPVDVNDAGTIVGLFQTADGVFHSFVRDQGVTVEFAVPFVGAVETEVRGVNNRGQIVGRYTVEQPDAGGTFASRGFVATPDRAGARPVRLAREAPGAETVTRLRAQEATASAGERHSKGRRLLARAR